MDSFFRKIPTKKFYSSKFYKTYQQALTLFWSQKRRDALSLISKTIEDEIDHEDIQIFYRLWIEVLAETNDRLNLQMLKNHLAIMAPKFADYDQWASLRGLVHFELEELDACSVILRAVGENLFSPYALELRQRYELRFSEEHKATMHILKSNAPITDYIILQSLARGLLSNAQTDLLPELLSRVIENFPNSPLLEEFQFWQKFDENKLEEAIKTGQKLCKRFPDNENYILSCLYNHITNTPQAKWLKLFDLKSLQRAHNLHKDNVP
jgi:hypothetical protein